MVFLGIFVDSSFLPAASSKSWKQLITRDACHYRGERQRGHDREDSRAGASRYAGGSAGICTGRKANHCGGACSCGGVKSSQKRVANLKSVEVVVGAVAICDSEVFVSVSVSE